MQVINALEMIDVSECNREFTAVTMGVFGFPLQVVVRIPAIVQTGQLVVSCLALQLDRLQPQVLGPLVHERLQATSYHGVILQREHAEAQHEQ